MLRLESISSFQPFVNSDNIVLINFADRSGSGANYFTFLNNNLIVIYYLSLHRCLLLSSLALLYLFLSSLVSLYLLQSSVTAVTFVTSFHCHCHQHHHQSLLFSSISSFALAVISHCYFHQPPLLWLQIYVALAVTKSNMN